MRISDQQIVSLTEYDMNSAYESLANAQTVLSTGQRINTPGDDPIGTASVLELQGSLAQNNSFSSTASDTVSWLQATATSINGVNDALVQARTLAVQGSNDTLTSEQRQAIAANVGQLLQGAVQSANGTYGNRYVLSGYQTGTAPFSVDMTQSPPTITYNGDSSVITREIAPGQTMQINATGSAVSPALQAIAQLQSDLQSGTSSQISADLTTIDQAHDQLLVSQATVGANTNRITALQSTIATTQENLTSQISTLKNANAAQAAVDFSTRSATYQAALEAAAKVVQPSLLEFLK